MTLELPAQCDQVLLGADEIKTRVAALGQAIALRHEGEEVRLITVLRGGIFFMADLARAIDSPVTMDYLAVSHFKPGGGGSVRVTKDLDDDITGSAVILVEDVVDTGLTINYVLSFLRSHGPRTLEVCALLDKPVRRIAEVPIAYCGFEMPDRFLIGYGLDLSGRYRNLPYIASMRESAVM